MAHSRNFYQGVSKTLPIVVAGLLIAVSMASCATQSVPPQDSSEPAANAPARSMAQSPQPTGKPAPALTTISGDPTAPAAPEPTLAPTQTPVVIMPSPTRAPTATPVGGPATETASKGSTNAGVSGAPEGPTLRTGPDTTWGDVFESLSDEERSCIRSLSGEDRLAQMLERPFALGGLGQESVALLQCVSDDSARELFLADMETQMGGLSAEEESCLRKLLGTFSPSELVAASTGEPSPDNTMLMLHFGLGLVTCLPQLAQEGGPTVPANGAGSANGGMQDGSLLWAFTTGGWVVTAPAVVDGVVYAGSDDHSLYALVARTGSLLWSYATGDVIRSTPTVVGGRVFFGSNDNHLYALDAATGQELWKHDTGDWVQYSPAVSGGRVYFPAPAGGDRRVHAVDAATGQVAWVSEHPFPIGPAHSPAPIGDRVYAQGAEYGQFYAHDAATGEVAWQAEVGGFVESAPTVQNGVVYLTVANRAYAFSESTGKVIWEVNTEEFPARDFPALVVGDICFLYPADRVYALDAVTGEVTWRYESGELGAELVVSDGVVYGSSAGAKNMFALDMAAGNLIWTVPMEDSAPESLSIIDGRLYGEFSNGHIFAANLADGSLAWNVERGGFSGVQEYSARDGVIYAGGMGNDLRAFLVP